ncbi:hypothetical protein [Timonella sp. A28]|uniref:hypothetical protein n=1 Tax=Timonella sp. A28 TaxID=3442640 RepID=UPI003EBB8D56
MTDDRELSKSKQERLEKQRRIQQANWFLGGILFVVCAAAGNALSAATTHKVFLFGGIVIGAALFWAVNKFAK